MVELVYPFIEWKMPIVMFRIDMEGKFITLIRMGKNTLKRRRTKKIFCNVLLESK